MNPNQTSNTSQKRLTANRANAQKSTGPKTPEGKQKSAQNARQHGFTAATFAVVRLEDLDETARLRADLINLYHPRHSQELFAIERLALAQQTLLRLARLEAGLFTAAFNEGVDHHGPLHHADVIGSIEVTRAQNQNFALADGFHRMAKQSNSWALFLRYQSQAERNYRRAQEDLDRLRSQFEDLPNEPIEEPETLQLQQTKEPPPPGPVLLTVKTYAENGQLQSITEDLVDPALVRNLPRGEF